MSPEAPHCGRYEPLWAGPLTSEVGPRVAVCFHGFLRTGVAMRPVRKRLLREGWRQVGLPTARYELRSLETLGSWAARRIREASTQVGGAAVDVVTHSMGGLVLRASLRHRPPVRRVVMLSPPNRGAQMARQVRSMLPIHRLGWDPLHPLLPGSPSALPLPEDVEVGVLTGGRGGRGYNPLLSGDNDGKVRVEEARLEGARAFTVVSARHAFIMAQAHVLDEVVHFLRFGEFCPAD